MMRAKRHAYVQPRAAARRLMYHIKLMNFSLSPPLPLVLLERASYLRIT